MKQFSSRKVDRAADHTGSRGGVVVFFSPAQKMQNEKFPRKDLGQFVDMITILFFVIPVFLAHWKILQLEILQC